MRKYLSVVKLHQLLVKFELQPFVRKDILQPSNSLIKP